MPEFVVVDCRGDVITKGIEVSAASPEAAAEKALGMQVHRAGARRG
ncbi:hypothetical protein [Devosia riboflavina]